MQGTEHDAGRIQEDPVRTHGSADPLGPTSEIGRKLKQYYDDLVSDEVPDRFAQLLAQLERASTPNSRTD